MRSPHDCRVDELIDSSRARLRVKIGAVIVLALVGLGCAVLVSVIGDSGSTAVAQREVIESGSVIDAPGTENPGDVTLGSGLGTRAAAGSIFVHILGAVANPGLYELSDGERAIDAVAAAGGFAENADQAQLNLARFVSDGEQIIVPIIGQAPPPGASAQPGVLGQSGKVNLNTADAAALETLPRVGPALAARIIAWRESNGRFGAIEELTSVSGIGEKTFDGLRELVTV